ncbi:hypothetical protein Micbo1qcDRAFT_235669 [Microdochium bolleyi]|uniref:RGS domain-containing protein n=1 Tax=Microdochium bolleyi TaxID=196109 RepID=A0A136IV24_9PEZI|nr:hypothetical protein Micbo1qcDRAFT_235669 [Microdochium bolleyi]
MATTTYDALGWFYIAFTIVWSVLLTGGMGFLYRHRSLPFLQIRKLGLIFCAVILLHLYAISCTLGITYGTMVPCEAQFWVMSIYLPFGMALLQAANSQFQYIASQQRRYASMGNLEDQAVSDRSTPIDQALPWYKRAILRCRNADKPTRTLVYIGIGMAVQFALTALVFFGSEMFHPGWGFFNVRVPGTEKDRAEMCLTGWEWWLSIVWQFFWTWLYAPYLLWKTRNVHDTHGWRIQTIGCCLCFLPASPMWLISLYVPAMAPVNAKFAPPMWFACPIFIAEILLIFVPCWKVLKTHELQKETQDAISSWEKRHKTGTVEPDNMSASSAGVAGTTLAGSIIARSTHSKSSATSKSSRRSDMLTMAGLENALRSNSQPLLEFAALKDFSGENVSFLSHVGDWKRSFGHPGTAISPRASVSAESVAQRERQFIRAVRIYSHFISLEYSEFPVNISSRAAKELHHIFDEAAHALNRRRSTQSDSATPFEDSAHILPRSGSSWSSAGSTSTRAPNNVFDLEATLGKANLNSANQMRDDDSERLSGGFSITIPDQFSPTVLDVAESEIKYLVLTNTWPKFVAAAFDSMSRVEAKEDGKSFPTVMRKYFCGESDKYV